MRNFVFSLSRLEGLAPTEKLVLWELAAFQNAETGQCNPSVTTLSKRTGLLPPNIKTAIQSLTRKGLIARCDTGWIFPTLSEPSPEVVPDDFWPSSEAIQQLVETYPNHHFNMEDAVRDFIAFCQRRGTKIAPENLDAAFVANISHLLNHRTTGTVEIGRSDRRNEAASVGSFLARLRG